MKQIAIIMALLPFMAQAQVTLILSDEITTKDGKICVYENAQRSEKVKMAKSAPCHHTMTFND